MDKNSHTEAYRHVDHVVRDPFLRRFAHAALHVRQHQRLYSLTAVWALALGLFPVFTSADDRGAPPATASAALHLDEPAATAGESAPDPADGRPLATELEGAPGISVPDPGQSEPIGALDRSEASELGRVETDRDDNGQAPPDEPQPPPPPPPAPADGGAGGEDSDDGCAEQSEDDQNQDEDDVLTDTLGGLVDPPEDDGDDETDGGCQPA